MIYVKKKNGLQQQQQQQWTHSSKYVLSDEPVWQLALHLIILCQQVLVADRAAFQNTH